jgi:VWFA-related protein
MALTCVSGYAGQSPSLESSPTIHSTSELVVVDVVATDAQQNPIHHLSASDFTISEDGHPQTIKVFEEHDADGNAPQPPMPKFQPGKFTNFSPAPANGALNILLLDKLNTPMAAQSVVRDQVLKYLKEAPGGTRIAIFVLTTQLRLLQGFTSDPTLLRSLVAGRKGLPGAPPMMNNSVSGDQPGGDNPMPGGDNLMTDTAMDALGNTPDAGTVLANLQQFEAEQQSFQSMLRASYTLDAFNQLARYLGGLPGRKNLIWFSGSFPISILPDENLQDPFGAVATEEDEFRQTVNLLARSQVSVYPIDARGLMPEPAMSAANSDRNYVKNPGAAMNDESKFFQQTGNEHSTMTQMADATGGKAFVDNNDLKAAIGKAIESGSNYYTVAYAPVNQNRDGNFRRIAVKVDRPGVKLAYRRGYFADEPGSTSSDEAQSAETDQTPYNAMRAAMQRGAPDPEQILFIADVRPGTSDTEPALAPGNLAAPKVSGPYRRYIVTFIANPKDMDCTATMDGEHHCVMEFLTYVYDVDGVLINTQTKGINAAFSPARYASFLKSPLTYRQQISVPVKGEYYLRLGMRDDNADHVGALELPVAAVAGLTPASTPTSTPTSTPSPTPAPASTPGANTGPK